MSPDASWWEKIRRDRDRHAPGDPQAEPPDSPVAPEGDHQSNDTAKAPQKPDQDQ